MKQTKHSRKLETQNLCSKYPPFTRTHAFKRLRHVQSLPRWWCGPAAFSDVTRKFTLGRLKPLPSPFLPFPSLRQTNFNECRMLLHALSVVNANSIVVCHVCCTSTCTGWLDVPERVQYKLGVTARRCQQHKAPQYLTDCVTPASDIASRHRLRSASRHQLLVPRYRLSSLGRRSFAVVGPMTWNSLSADLRDPTCSDESFRRSLKTFLFTKY